MSDWIWLNAEQYPEYQNTWCTTFAEHADMQFVMAEFRREILLRDVPARVAFRVSGDTKYWFWADDIFLGMGPVCAGGDYGNRLPMPFVYASRYFCKPQSAKMILKAFVQLSPAVMTDASCGHGGFYLEGVAEYADGSSEAFGTDTQWLVRPDARYLSPDSVDFTRHPAAWTAAEVVPSVWHLKDSPLPHLREEILMPTGISAFDIPSGQICRKTILFDKIYAAYPTFSLQISGLCRITLTPFELEGQEVEPIIILADHAIQFRAIKMYSVGGYHLEIQNMGTQTAICQSTALVSVHYPCASLGNFRCSDADLNRVYDVCRHTLNICRQSLHLDSPRHQETLGCTGDYYIESLMNYFADGDARLTRLDLLRTADWLNMADGFMFHTTYSLLWVEMLHDYYMYTGDIAILSETHSALKKLFRRFSAYLGENGLIETPPSWMFIDWMEVDGYSLHHPPKALGQTSLCALYHRALHTAADIEQRLQNDVQAKIYLDSAKNLRKAAHVWLYDEDTRLYWDGLTTEQSPCGRPLPPDMVDVRPFMPKNAPKRYHTKQANTLAVLCGLCEGDTAQAIMQKVIEDDTLSDYQPYFAHFVLDALWKTKLFPIYGMSLLRRWTSMVNACDKGLQEGWNKPCDSYSFDHSHAWGGTPVYQLPCRLLGLEILEPAFRKIALRPDSMGLDFVEIALPTPYGILRCHMRHGDVQLEIPKEISVLYTK